MIKVYPMLVSQAVSENVIPGITKTLENYIIINAQDMIITDPEMLQRKKQFKIKGKKLTLKESVQLNEADDDDDEFWNYKRPGGGTKNTPTPTPTGNNAKKTLDKIEKMMADLERKEKELSKKKKAEKDRIELQKQREKLIKMKDDIKDELDKLKIKKVQQAKASIKMQDNKAISIEPTYITVETTDKYGNTMNTFLGIKVLPLRVKSDAKLSHLILHDTKLNFIAASLVSIGRKVTRTFYKIWGKLTFTQNTPTGDPRNDILMGMTGHRGDGFIVLSKNEDIDDTFLTNIGRLNRLFKMGWNNIIIVDDVNRVAYFCMRKFKGVCMAVNFSIMYQNVGQLKVYETLEDVKKQSSSVFRIKKSFSKVVAEWVVDNRQAKYINEDKKHG